MICIIDCGSSFVKDIHRCAQEAGHQSTVVPMQDMGDVAVSVFSHIIISGSPTLITQVDTKRFITQFQFLVDCPVPILGICNGHQVMGLLYGADITLGNLIHGMQPITILDENPLFQGMQSGTLFREEHRESISLPDAFTRCASSETCENEAMKHKEKPLYGVQFHPEVSGEAGARVIKNFLSIQ